METRKDNGLPLIDLDGSQGGQQDLCDDIVMFINDVACGITDGALDDEVVGVAVITFDRHGNKALSSIGVCPEQLFSASQALTGIAIAGGGGKRRILQ